MPATARHAQTVLRLAQTHHFALVGIAPARPSPYADHIRAWLAAGKHGQMDYLADAQRVMEMLDVRQLVPHARAVICFADLYPGHASSSLSPREREGVREASPPARQEPPSEFPLESPPLPKVPPPPLGRIARYAHGSDYHWRIKRRLHRLADALTELWPRHTFRSCVDTAPVLEREHAQRAGLGWVGKNTMLIHPELGSYFFLGEIITTLPLQTAEDLGTTLPDHCGSCTRCIDACPTRCIDPAGYTLDAARCLSYLTIEHAGPLADGLHAPLGNWIAGCDVCQEVCPYNQHSAGAPAGMVSLLELLHWNADARRRALEKSALKRITLEQWKRNALIAAGNYLRVHDAPALRRRLEQLAQAPDEPEELRLTARAAVIVPCVNCRR